jgi:hypothetical protein
MLQGGADSEWDRRRKRRLGGLLEVDGRSAHAQYARQTDS